MILSPAVTLQVGQEAVKQACGSRQQGEQEQETDSAKTSLQTATEEQQGCYVQEELSKGLVVKRVRQQSLEVSILKNRGTDTKDILGQIQICLDTQQHTR